MKAIKAYDALKESCSLLSSVYIAASVSQLMNMSPEAVKDMELKGGKLVKYCKALGMVIKNKGQAAVITAEVHDKYLDEILPGIKDKFIDLTRSDLIMDEMNRQIDMFISGHPGSAFNTMSFN